MFLNLSEIGAWCFSRPTRFPFCDHNGKENELYYNENESIMVTSRKKTPGSSAGCTPETH